MAKRTYYRMNAYYKELVNKEKITIKWKVVHVQSENTGGDRWVIARDGRFPDAGFWLNQAHRVDSLGGSFEVKCTPSSKKEIRNINVRFRWLDRIDTNPTWGDTWYVYDAEWLNQGT